MLRKVQTDASTWAHTYYVYDDYGNRVCVLQPEAVKNIIKSPSAYFNQTDAVKNTFLATWAFRYTFDSRKRMTQQQLPGVALRYFVYDNLDRTVLTQDGVQRASRKWFFTRYDALSRPVITGLYTHGTTLDQAGMTALLNTVNMNESYNGDANNHGYTNTVLTAPNFNASGFEVLTVSYYDNYAFKSLLSNAEFDYKNSELTASGSLPAQQSAALAVAKNQVTGAKSKIAGITDWVWVTRYFDDQYHIIQETGSTQRGGYCRTTLVYNFVGKPVRKRDRYAVTGQTAKDVYRRYAYDAAGRLLQVWHQVDANAEVLITQQRYNELGQASGKQLHQAGTAAALQDVAYRYNIRGWLTHINDPVTPQGDDFFNLELRYNNPGTSGGTAQYNGSVAEAVWNSGGQSNQSYGYGYDFREQLTEAKYYSSGANDRFTEKDRRCQPEPPGL